MKVQRKTIKLFGKGRTLVGLGGIEDPNIVWYLEEVGDAEEIYDGGLCLENWNEDYLTSVLEKQKQEKLEKVWEKTLALWKKLSETPDEKTNMLPRAYRNSMLIKLGLSLSYEGCPFCDQYRGTPNCPLGDCDIPEGIDVYPPCMSTPYRYWDYDMRRNRWHRQVLAREFYDFLMRIKEIKK